MDWLEKSQTGTDDVSKNKYKKDEFGLEFLKQVKSTYSFFQYNTPYIAQAILHLVIGQLPTMKAMRIPVDANYIDTRVHVVWFQQAGSGKGRGYNFTKMLCDGLKLKWKPVLEISDAKLIGGYEPVERYNAKKKEKTKEYIFVPGVLTPGSADIVSMNEASVLFNMKQTSYQKHAMDYYQIAMNTMGTADNIIPKDVLHGDGTIECRPDCSLFFSSYIPDKFNQVIAERGFASRTFNIINEISTEDRYEAMRHSARYFNKKREKAYHDLSDIIGKLKFINQYYAGHKKLDHTPGVGRAINNLTSQIYETTLDIEKFHRKKLEEFMHRYQDLGYKFIYHSCCMRLGDKIEPEDVAYAEKYLMSVWRKFITYLEESMAQDRRDKYREEQLEVDILNAYNKFKEDGKYVDKDGYMPRPMLKKYLKLRVWKCSPATIDKRVRDAEKSGLLERSKKGKIPCVRLIRNPKDPI